MELNDIEHKIACGEMNAAQVFTQMKQHIPRATTTNGGDSKHIISPIVLLPTQWDIEQKDWPWNKTHGQNQIMVLNIGDVEIVRIAVCEVIEAAGNKFVSAHLKLCQKDLDGFCDT